MEHKIKFGVRDMVLAATKRMNQLRTVMLVTLLTYGAAASSALNVGIDMVSTDSVNTQTTVPVTFGHVFKKGDVSASSFVNANISGGANIPTQMDGKAYHDDGSLRHALITVELPSLVASDTVSLALTDSSSSGVSGSNVTLTELLAKNSSTFDAVITTDIGGTIYSASARTLLEAAQSGTEVTWISGPLATEWIVSGPMRKADLTAHAHLTARFNIRAYKNADSVLVDVVLENNWSYVPEPQDETYALTITVGGSQVYQNASVTHFEHSRWRKQYWWGAEPKIHIAHDIPYLISTEAVPYYDSSIRTSAAGLSELAGNWSGANKDIMGLGLTNDKMGTGGYVPGIGPLPRWTARYLLSMDQTAKEGTLGTADLAGSWSIHYRDVETDSFTSIDKYPFISEYGNADSGDMYNPYLDRDERFPSYGSKGSSTSYEPDGAHQPSFSYIPYIVTGDYYHLEEMMFWANWSILRATPAYRGEHLGLMKWDQVRGQAWVLRTVAQTGYIAPNDHPMKQYFIDKVNNNITWYIDNYVNEPSANQLGWIWDGTIQPFLNNSRPWMDDFFTWMSGHIVALGHVNAVPLLNWKLQFPVGRMIGTGYCWVYGAPYSMVLGDVGTGETFSSFAELYAGNAADYSACGTQAMADVINSSSDAVIEGEMKTDSHSPYGYPSKMQPALAVAVESGFTNATEAWTTFQDRSVIPDYMFNPQYAVVPRPVVNPSADALPIISFSAIPSSISTGEASELTWTASNTSDGTCVASQTWDGTKSASGNESVTPTSTSVYSLACSNSTGTRNYSVTVTLNSSGGTTSGGTTGGGTTGGGTTGGGTTGGSTDGGTSGGGTTGTTDGTPSEATPSSEGVGSIVYLPLALLLFMYFRIGRPNRKHH